MDLVAVSCAGRLAKATFKPASSSALSNVAVAAGVAAAIVSGFVGTTQAQVPQIDINQTCRSAAAAMVILMGGSTSQRDFDICLDSEQKAREQIGKDWSTYAADDRTQCLQSQVYLPSYIEWLTCLEMETAVKKMRQEQKSQPR